MWAKKAPKCNLLPEKFSILVVRLLCIFNVLLGLMVKKCCLSLKIYDLEENMDSGGHCLFSLCFFLLSAAVGRENTEPRKLF